MEQSPTIGLVLSGGGSKGAYQAGVYKAMEEKGLLPRIRAVAGTSIGSFNALLFTCGTIAALSSLGTDQLFYPFDLCKAQFALNYPGPRNLKTGCFALPIWRRPQPAAP